MDEDNPVMRKFERLVQFEAKSQESRYHSISVMENIVTCLKGNARVNHDKIESLNQIFIAKQNELVELELDNKHLSKAVQQVKEMEAQCKAAVEEGRLLHGMFEPSIITEVQTKVANVSVGFETKVMKLQHALDEFHTENLRVEDELQAEANAQKIQEDKQQNIMRKITEEAEEYKKKSDSVRDALQPLEEEGRELKMTLQEKENQQRVILEKNEALKEELKEIQHNLEQEKQENSAKQSELEAERRCIDEKLVLMEQSVGETKALNSKLSKELSAQVSKRQLVEDSRQVLKNISAIPEEMKKLVLRQNDVTEKRNALNKLHAEIEAQQTRLLDTEQRAFARQLAADAMLPQDQEKVDVVTAEVCRVKVEITGIQGRIAELHEQFKQRERTKELQRALEEQQSANKGVMKDMRTQRDNVFEEYQALKESYNRNYRECALLKRRIGEQQEVAKRAATDLKKVSSASVEMKQKTANAMEDADASSDFSQKTFNGVVVERFDPSHFRAAFAKK